MRRPFQPRPNPGPRRIGIVIFPGFQLLDAAGPIAAFEAARALGLPYELALLADGGGPVTSSAGIDMQASDIVPMISDESASGAMDTLIVVGGAGARGVAFGDRLVQFVGGEAGRTRRVASVCTGSYILAMAGLLNGRRATTHWAHAADFARLFPRVKVEPDRIFIREGSIWTSAGVTAGIDLSLALIAEDGGEPLARQVARHLVVYYRRSGGQSQFSTLLEASGSRHRFVELMRWVREHLDEELGIERLAERVAMSPRQFARAFLADTGFTPARAIQRLRLEEARERIENRSLSIARIARETGFGTAECMRRAFIRAYGHPPHALRAAIRPD